MSHPLYNPAAGPTKPWEMPARYPTRAECITALRAGIEAASARFVAAPETKPAHIANTAGLAVLATLPPPDSAQVRQAEMVVLANWLGARIRDTAPDVLADLFAGFDALCAAAPLPEE